MTRLFTAAAVASVLFVLAACGGSTAPATPTPAASTSAAPDTIPGKYIVNLKPGASINDINRLGNSLEHRPDFTYRTALMGFAGTLSPAELARLNGDPAVDFIEPDRPVYATPGPPGGSPPGGGNGGGGGGESPPPQELPWGIDRIDAELNGGSGGAGIAVAVLDTGVDLDHEDLANVVDGANFDKPGNPADDDNGHGTHVAGTIAAADNNLGYVGVAPNATIVAVKVLNRRGSGSYSSVIGGIDWVAANAGAHGIKVANMSLTGYGYSASMYNAIAAATAAGVTFVVAAGNDDSNAANYSPAGFSNVITVSALNPNDTFAYYSNWGAVVDVIAPGTNVESLWKNNGYKTISGTSMATPHVAGAAALFLDGNNPNDTFADVYAAITDGENAPAGGWVGDPDGIAEDLVDAQGM